VPAAPTSGDSGSALIDRYSIWEKIGLYAAILVFMTFILAPFVEAFMVSGGEHDRCSRAYHPALQAGC